MRIRRALYLLHRWFGVGMCLLFALWFGSGIIMMYVQYPELTEAERLANLPPIDPGKVSIGVEEAIQASGIHGGISRIGLSALGARPAYSIRAENGLVRTVFADNGERLDDLSPETVLESVAHSGFAAGATPIYDQMIDMDQWTVSAELNEHRPLHRVRIDDDAGTVIYVSGSTGQIVRDSDRRERFWNWLGSTIHWIYPMQLRRHVELWSNVIIYLSLAGLVSIATGAIIGFLRLRVSNRHRGGRITPYRGVMKWHHLLGLGSLVFVATFMFSGLMSMQPWGIFDSSTSAAEQIRRFTGGPIHSLGAFPRIDWPSFPSDVKEVEWLTVGGQGHLVLSRSATDRQALIGEPSSLADAERLQERITHALPSLVPEAAIAGIETLTEYDDYYYSHHNTYRPLPVYRVRFDDPESTWFHIDTTTGKVITRHTDASRLGRWLFNGLHSLDFAFLLRRGVVWDLTMILLSAVGLVFSVTSVILGWRWLARSMRHRSSRASAMHVSKRQSMDVLRGARSTVRSTR